MSRSSLPLVVAVNCLDNVPPAKLRALEGVARFKGLGTGWGGGDLRLLEQADVVLLLTLQDTSTHVQQRLKHARAVVLVTPGDNKAETELARELQVQKLLQVEHTLDDEFADTTMALMLSLLRRTHKLSAALTRGTWMPAVSQLRGARRCSGLRLGLIGMDSVAFAVARRASAFGMIVWFFNPSNPDAPVPPTADGQKYERAPTLAALLAESDVLSLHCQPPEDAAHLLREAELRTCKRGSVLVNTCSGALVEPVALKLALQDGLLGGAALDAPEGESWLESWVRDVPNLLITPRTAFYSDQAFEEQCDTALQMVADILQGPVAGAGEEWAAGDGTVGEQRAEGGKGEGTTPAPRRSADAGPSGGTIAGRETTAPAGAPAGGAVADEAPSGAEEAGGES